MPGPASTTKTWYRFFVATVSVLSAGVITARLVGPRLAKMTLGAEFQLHRFQAEVTSGKISTSPAEEFIVLGDSTASRSIALTEATTGSALSFAVQGGTLMDSYFLVRRYLRNNNTPKCFVLMTSYGAATKNYPPRFWSVFVRQNFYEGDELDELYELSASVNVFPARDFAYWQYRQRIAEETFWNLFRWDLLSDFIFRPHNQKLAYQRYRWARLHRGSLPWHPIRSSGVSSFITPYSAHLSRPFATDALSDLAISRVAEIENSHVLILYPPIAMSLKSPASEAWFSALDKHFKTLSKKHPNVIVGNSSPWLSDINFIDGTHLGASDGGRFLLSQSAAIKRCMSQAAHSN